MPRSVKVALASRRNGSPVAHLLLDDGVAYSLLFTSEGFAVAGVGWTFATIERQGRKPLVRRANRQAMTLTFTHTISEVLNPPAGWGSATRVVKDLMGLADSGRKVRLLNVTAGIESRGWWYPQLSVSVTARNGSQQIRTAELTWTLTEVIEDRAKIGRPPPRPRPRPAPVKKKAAATQSSYTVVSGDSLWSIAARLLGNGERWREIFHLNQARYNIPPAVMYRGLLTVWIQIGWVLRIPAR